MISLPYLYPSKIMAPKCLKLSICLLFTLSLSTTAHALLVPDNLPGTWAPKGCYTNGVDGVLLSGDVMAGGEGMTIGACVAFCSGKGYVYAEAELSGHECYCGDSIADEAVSRPESECDVGCLGDAREACGGSKRMSIFWSGTPMPSRLELRADPSSTSSTSSAAPTATPYTSIGCYTEATSGRALSGAAFYDDFMTIELCGTKCSAFTYFGVEYGRECYCGNSFNGGSVPAATGDCSFSCPGNVLEKCGAGNRLSVWSYGSAPSSSSVTRTNTASVTSTSSISTAIPTGWEYRGCYVDGVNGRILTHQSPDMAAPNGLTLQKCIAYCSGYTIVGLEYGQQCFCDNAIHNGGALALSDSDCSVPCAGDSTRKCGGGNRVSLYSIGEPKIYQPPAPQKTGLPANWKYVGCLQDNQLSKPNPYADPVTGAHESVRLRTFPYALPQDTVNMTATACITKCQQFGYNAAGIEVGTQCFCGDAENILIASDPYTDPRPIEEGGWQYDVPPVVLAGDDQCSNLCSGDPQYYCGANDRLVYYTWNGTQPLYSWSFPQGNSAGEYSLLIGGVTVPLITSQLVTGKVSFVQKTGTGFRNGTGVYELDLTQIDNFDAAWRTMDAMQTDVFCAAGLTLPDKVGRQLTVAGWNFESNWGVRLLWPDGSAGVKGRNQWQEAPEHTTLQLPRWYPSAIIMANGSILIVGGEVSQNAAQQPSLELLPPTGVPLYNVSETYSGFSNTTVYLDFLDRTGPDNLYPFLAVLPSGGIFVGYFNEARILNEVNFQTTRTLPNIPGAVNNDKGGRTYQLEGTMVTLPQYAPYTAHLGILICGGSTPNDHMALDNCVTIEPEAQNPVWTIERMPSRRVMSCMAGLPDGTYLILNGGQHGAAGFGLAGEPNYNAILYDPRKPLNNRMSVMANTTVPRMYHSEAITLLDGRVLVSGSDPSGNDPNDADGNPLPVDPNIYPEEFRVEVFTPPYLLSGLRRPTFSIVNKDWSYGQSVTFTLDAAPTGTVQVSLLGSVVSTHGNNMGQRTLFPAVTCSGTTCTVTAPPNAHVCPPGWFMVFVLDGPTPSVGVFVRIGGDPAELGNWPNVPGIFDLPGI